MAVGRWVYTAEQIATHVVSTRSRLDRALQVLSAQDVRIAWIGWIARLCVWAVRAVLDTAYLLVALSKRALSREMELQADLVAVSLAGSDALVHALYKLHAAEHGFDAAVGTLHSKLRAAARVPDVYALQTRFLENIRRVTADATYGEPPTLPESGGPEHRVFEKLLAQPSKMWATHPPDREREDNAKRTYVPCALDDRPARVLLHDASASFQAMTGKLVDAMLAPAGSPDDKTARAAPGVRLELSTMAPELALAAFDESFDRAFNRPEFRGVYLGRALTRSVASSSELFDASARTPWGETAIPSLNELYPVDMRDAIEKWERLVGDHAMLIGLLEGRLTASDAQMNYRGSPLRRVELPALVAQVGREKKAAEAAVAARDRTIRTVHQRIARKVGRGWDAYHESVVKLVHYAEHTAADIADASGHLDNTYAMVTAGGQVGVHEIERLLAAARVAYDALARAYAHKAQVVLPLGVLAKMNRSRTEKERVESWSARLGSLTLSTPNEANLGQWLQPAQSWLGALPLDLALLADAALEELLEVEETLRGPEESLVAAPAPAGSPAQYATMEPGRERKRQRRLGLWGRFQLADGIGPGVARAAVAAGVLGVMVFAGGIASYRPVYAYNGLGVRVRVTVGDEVRMIDPGGSAKFEFDSIDRVHVKTVTWYGVDVEEFNEDVSDIQSTYVYDVARAGLLYRVRLTFGNDRGIEESDRSAQPEIIGNPRWSADGSWHRFDEPRQAVTLARHERRTTRTFLEAADQSVAPRSIMASARTSDERQSMVRAHLRFDPVDGRYEAWALLARDTVPDLAAIVRRRAETSVTSPIPLMRIEQDLASPAEHGAVCERQRRWADDHPGAGGDYLRARCTSDPAQREQALRDALGRYPSDEVRPYLAYAVSYEDARRGAWSEVVRLAESASSDPLLGDNAALAGARAERVRWALALLEETGHAPENMGTAPLGRFVEHSERLTQALASENGAGNLADSATRALAVGQLSEALSRSGADAAPGYFVQLVGASDGADRAQIDAALDSAAIEEVTLVSFWLAALSLRERGSVADSIVVSTEVGRGSLREMVQWLSALRAQPVGAEPGDVPREFDQPIAMAMATITLGDRAPVRWRTVARAYYFAGERPYFAAEGGAAAAAPEERGSVWPGMRAR